MIVLGEQIGEVAGFTLSMTAQEAKTVKCERMHGNVLRKRVVSLMQQLRDELGICVSVCRRNMAAEKKILESLTNMSESSWVSFMAGWR